MKYAWYEIETEEQAKELIGSVVYEPYTPSRVGKIVDCYLNHVGYNRPNHLGYHCFASVRWLKQTKKYPHKQTEVRLSHLQDYEKLIADHKRKYEKHAAILKKVQESC